jgi:hypothetical protein
MQKADVEHEEVSCVALGGLEGEKFNEALTALRSDLKNLKTFVADSCDAVNVAPGRGSFLSSEPGAVVGIHNSGEHRDDIGRGVQSPQSPPGRLPLAVHLGGQSRASRQPAASLDFRSSCAGISSDEAYSRARTQRLFCRKSAPGNVASIRTRMGLVPLRRVMDSSCANKRADRLAIFRCLHPTYNRYTANKTS